MSDFFMPNRSEISQQNYSRLETLQDIFGGIQQQNNQSVEPYEDGNLIHSSELLVQLEQYNSQFGLVEDATPIQIYEFQEPQIQKSVFFRSSGEFEKQIEEIEIDRFNMQAKILQDSQEQEFNIKIESEEQINSKFKPEIMKIVNQYITLENKDLFNLNQAKSIYTNKITPLVEHTQNRIDLTSKLSKTQQKLYRKTQFITRDQFTASSYEMQSNQTPDGNIDLLQQKLSKNRESARNSRARKKLYYELLETKVKELQDEVERLKQSNHYQSNYTEICNKTEENFQTFLDYQQQQLFDKLETCLLQNKDNQEITIALDALIYKTNSNSQERNDTARKYFESMIEVCLPIQTKYQIYSLDKYIDFFVQQPDDYTYWMKEIFKKTQIQPNQIINVKCMKSKLLIVRNNISNSIQKVKDQLKLIQSEATQVDQMWEQLKKCFTPFQLGSCIIAMRQNSFRQELQISSLFIELKNSQKSKEDQKIQKSDQFSIINNKKLIKKNLYNDKTY